MPADTVPAPGLDPEFEVRELVIGHQPVWDVIVAALEAHGMLAVPGPIQHDDDEDGLPWWFVAPKPPRSRRG
jgi:hypothetical protein